jgi:hypothetical protein
MKNNLTEARFQFLAGVINENEFKQLDKPATEAISSFPPFEVIVERGELNDEEETEAKFVQILFFEIILFFDFFLNIKKERKYWQHKLLL